jgi:hypothetical protein
VTDETRSGVGSVARAAAGRGVDLDAGPQVAGGRGLALLRRHLGFTRCRNGWRAEGASARGAHRALNRIFGRMLALAYEHAAAAC